MFRFLMVVCVMASGSFLQAEEAVEKAIGTEWEQALEEQIKELREELENLKAENKKLKAQVRAIEKQEARLERDRSKLVRDTAKLAVRDAYVNNREINAIAKGKKLYAEKKKREAAEKAAARKRRRDRYGVQKRRR